MVIKLSVHKNTLKQHRAKSLRRGMNRKTRALQAPGLNGYAMVAWYDDGSCDSCWSIGDTDPYAMPDKVRNVLIRRQMMMDMEARDIDR